MQETRIWGRNVMPLAKDTEKYTGKSSLNIQSKQIILMEFTGESKDSIYSAICFEF